MTDTPEDKPIPIRNCVLVAPPFSASYSIHPGDEITVRHTIYPPLTANAALRVQSRFQMTNDSGAGIDPVVWQPGKSEGERG